MVLDEYYQFISFSRMSSVILVSVIGNSQASIDSCEMTLPLAYNLRYKDRARVLINSTSHPLFCPQQGVTREISDLVLAASAAGLPLVVSDQSMVIDP
jgi:hypothetical protein